MIASSLQNGDASLSHFHLYFLHYHAFLYDNAHVYTENRCQWYTSRAQCSYGQSIGFKFMLCNGMRMWKYYLCVCARVCVSCRISPQQPAFWLTALPCRSHHTFLIAKEQRVRKVHVQHKQLEVLFSHLGWKILPLLCSLIF